MKKAAATVILLIFAFSVVSAETGDPAILSRGPILHEGIEFLGVNAIPSNYGEYRYGEDLVAVYFTDEQIFLSEKWTAGSCGIPGLMQSSDEHGRIVLAYTDKKEWTAFLSFKADAEYICGFVEAYRSRQNYFLNIARDKTLFSFPAFLEVD